jgi:hypothetical protein
MTDLFKTHFDAIEVGSIPNGNRRMLVAMIADTAPQEFEYDCITALIKLTVDQYMDQETQYGPYDESVEPD